MDPLLAALIGVGSAVFVLVVGKVWDGNSEQRRWLRDKRLSKNEAVLRDVDDVREYCTRMTWTNTRRPPAEKERDLYNFGTKQRVVINECSGLRLIGTPKLRDAADELATFIRDTLNEWAREAKQEADADHPKPTHDPVLVQLSVLIGAFETEARQSISRTGLRETISDS